MSVQVTTGSFTLSTSAGNHTISGIGFQPTAIICYCPTSSGSSFGYSSFFGVATSATEQWCMGADNDDGRATAISIIGEHFSDTSFIKIVSNSIIQYEASLASFHADGFVYNTTTGSETNYILYYIALGGNITANAGTFNSAITTGNQSITGIGFRPGCVLIGNSALTTSTGIKASISNSLGIATSSAEQWVMSINGVDSNPTVTDEDRYFNTDRIINKSITAPTITDAASYVSHDTDGFTINNTVAATSRIYGYLALGGSAHYYAGNFASATATGNQFVTGVGFKPSVNLFMGNGHTAVGYTTNGNFMYGAGQSSTKQHMITTWAEDNVATTSVRVRQATTSAIRYISTSAGTTVADAAFVSQDTDGFTVNWTVADASARVNLFLAIGSVDCAESLTSIISSTGQSVSSAIIDSHGIDSQIC